jgi:hypothetical protein
MSRVVKILDQEVLLDTNHLTFTESNLNEFLQTSPIWFAYYSEKSVQANHIAMILEDEYDYAYAESFKLCKIKKFSDKHSEMIASTDDPVKDKLTKYREAKETAYLISSFLRSLDKAITNALNLGYNKRKEMDKLGTDILYQPKDEDEYKDPKERLNEILGTN